MGLRTISMESLVKPLKRPKKDKVRHICSSCGEPSKYEICVVCTVNGRNISRLFATYEKARFIPESPIIGDIYTVLGLQGEITIERLTINISVSNEIMMIYVEKLRRRGKVRVRTHMNGRGQTHALVSLTPTGLQHSRAWVIVKEEHERRYGATCDEFNFEGDDDAQGKVI